MSEFENKSILKQVLMAPVRITMAIMGWLAAASEVFERGFQRAAMGASKVGDAATQADSVLGRVLGLLMAPLIWLYSGLIYPVSRVFQNNPVLQKIGGAAYWLWYPLAAISSFGRTFLQTRSRDLLIWTLPIVVVVGGSLAALWLLNPRDRSVTQRYRQAFDEAIAKGEFQQAALYQQKLQSLGIKTDQADMRRIEDLVIEGKTAQAIELAERIAPEDKPGSPDVHFWLARVYFEEQGSLTGKESLDKADLHLSRLDQSLQALNIGGEGVPPNVTMLKALVEFKKNDPEKGLTLLKSVSRRFWPALVLQLETHIKMNREEDAIQDAISLSGAVEKEPQLLNEVSALFFPMWCAALQKAGEKQHLKTAVYLWHQRYPEDVQGLGLWAQYQFQEIDTLLVRGSGSDLARASSVLVDVTNKLGAKNQAGISSWMLNRLPPKGSNPNYLQLATLVAKEPAVSSTVLEILGTAATLRGDHKMSLDLLKQATEKDPENAIAWNNLAFVANQHFPEEIELALKAADNAAQRQPQNMDILHTRGFIRMKLKQWDLAVEDLRAVVAERPNAQDVHLGLAQAYNALGKTDLAEFHRLLAK